MQAPESDTSLQNDVLGLFSQSDVPLDAREVPEKEKHDGLTSDVSPAVLLSGDQPSPGEQWENVGFDHNDGDSSSDSEREQSTKEGIIPQKNSPK